MHTFSKISPVTIPLLHPTQFSLKPIFFDTEFSGLHQQAYLLSIAFVPLEGPWFYAVFTEADTGTLGSWQQTNVVPNLLLTQEQRQLLPPGTYVRGSKVQIAKAIRHFLAGFRNPKDNEQKTIALWADVPAYDWVLFCELFGGAFGLPKHIHYIVRDLATLLETKGHDIDTDRFALAYEEQGADAGSKVRSSDGRGGEGQTPAATTEGLLRHNALGDALACRACYQKLIAK